ncbi:MAG TPA: SGNH/GDSL hydrolase family protein [Longimicrobium sp.]|nr:SGNH/GDSL hydrolase family protein [Longimicrobium sp.]
MSRPLTEYHPVIGYRFVPGLKARVQHEGGGYLVRANAAGFRSEHEFTPAKPAGVFRVLLFGDSFTAGDGVSNRDRYGDLLEQAVPGLQVFNYGLSGTGTDQQYLAWKEMARGIEHDLLVIAVQVENIRRVEARMRIFDADGRDVALAKPYFTLGDGGRLELHNVPVPREPVPVEAVSGDQEQHLDRGGDFAGLRRLVNRLGMKEVVQTITRYQPLPGYNRADTPGWSLMRAILSRWVGEAAGPVMIVPVPLYHYVEETSSPEPYRRRFAELARDTGAMLHDPLDDFHRVPKAERRALRWQQDIHPTPAWHRVMADSLAARLRPLASAATQPADAAVE